jgi:hypothetical protein
MREGKSNCLLRANGGSMPHLKSEAGPVFSGPQAADVHVRTDMSSPGSPLAPDKRRKLPAPSCDLYRSQDNRRAAERTPIDNAGSHISR